MMLVERHGFHRCLQPLLHHFRECGMLFHGKHFLSLFVLLRTILRKGVLFCYFYISRSIPVRKVFGGLERKKPSWYDAGVSMES